MWIEPDIFTRDEIDAKVERGEKKCFWGRNQRRETEDTRPETGDGVGGGRKETGDGRRETDNERRETEDGRRILSDGRWER